MNRSTLITQVHRRMSTLGTMIGLSDDEASYGTHVDYALRALGLAAVTDAVGRTINRLMSSTRRSVLEEARGYYMVRVDIELGLRREKASQVLERIMKELELLGAGEVYTLQDQLPATWDDYTVTSGDRRTWPLDWWQRGYDEPA